MQKYRGSSLVRAGFIGVVLIALVIMVGLQPQKLWAMATSVRYQAVFAEAGGLSAGNNVKVSGVTVGTVSDITLERGAAMVTFSVNSAVPIGSDTTASIGIATVLGERVLELEPAGSRSLGAGGVIPLSQTGSPYSLTDAVGEFTSNTAATDTAAINQSLDTLSDTIERIAPQLAPTFDGRSTAIAFSTYRMLHTLGLGQDLAPHACRMDRILVTDGRRPGAASGRAWPSSRRRPQTESTRTDRCFSSWRS